MNITKKADAIEIQKTHIIVPSHDWISFGLRELWEYRELLYFLIWRDIKVRYKQTVLGATWAILQPLFTMVVFSVFFGRLARVPSDGIPYPIFAFCALVPWQLFANALSMSTESLVANKELITKVYFPRLAIPISAVLAGLVDFAIAFIVLVGMMFYYGIALTKSVFILPLLILFTIATSLAGGLWLSALNVQYRDIRYTIPFVIQFWLFATPIAYPASLLSEPWRSWYGLNPMAGVVEGFRWVLLGKTSETGLMIIVSVLAVSVILISGLMYFKHMEQTFADVV